MNNEPYGSLFGPSASDTQFALGGHGETVTLDDNLRGVGENMPFAEIIGDDVAHSINIGTCVPTFADSTVNPEIQEVPVPICEVRGEPGDRFDFREELLDVLYSGPRAIEVLGRMILVLQALMLGTMTLTDEYVAVARNTTMSGMSGINFVTYGSESYRTIMNALLQIYTRAVKGRTSINYSTILMMRRTGQAWNRQMGHAVEWDYSIRRIMAENTRNSALRAIRSLLPRALFTGVDTQTFRRLVALHIMTYANPYLNPSSATYTYHIPSSASSVGPRRANVPAQFVSASVLAIMGGRFGGGISQGI